MMSSYQIWISNHGLAEMRHEAAQSAPMETGGILLGYWALHSSEVVITHVIGPGPHAIHEKCRFVPDYSFHEAQAAAFYFKSSQKLQYLGDWHSHPAGSCYLSKKDKKTMQTISQDAGARAERPLMIVVVPGPQGIEMAWVGTPRKRFLRRSRLEIQEAQLHAY